MKSRLAVKTSTDPRLWIEHVVLGKHGSGKLVMLTFDLDIIQEDLTECNGSDVGSFRSGRDDRSVRPAVNDIAECGDIEGAVRSSPTLA